MQNRRPLIAIALLLTLPLAHAAKPTKAGAPPKAVELACEAMPGEAPGHYVCETREGFEQCQTLAGGAPVLLNGATTPVKVLRCVQGG